MSTFNRGGFEHLFESEGAGLLSNRYKSTLAPIRHGGGARVPWTYKRKGCAKLGVTMNRSEIESLVTSMVTAQLREGRVPWRKTWASKVGRPTNLATRHQYTGVNWLVLSMQDVPSQLWVTYKQAQALGGQVRKGSKGIHCIKYGTIDTGKVDAKGKPILRPFLKAFTVFNVSQCDGLTIPADLVPVKRETEILPAVETMLANYANRPTVYHGDYATPHYKPTEDTIHMPEAGLFDSVEEYATALAHEMTHSTGHQSRENRDIMNRFGCEGYAKEELVAEMGAAMMMVEYGIDIDLPNTASYLASWLKALNDDPSLLVTASAKAQKAVDRMTGKKAVVEVEEEVSA